MTIIFPRVPESWRAPLTQELSQTYLKGLKRFLECEYSEQQVYPPAPLIFQALEQTPYDKVRVVILGQDPYHGPGQAMGMCFSVPEGIPKPPSLANIFQELHQDLGAEIPASGNLEGWARQGVLLLNTVLTVRAHQANSHRDQGWERFTDAVIVALNRRERGMVFLLWGGPAGKKAAMIDGQRHGIFQAPHPSPLSAHRGYFGSRPFSKANQWLESRGLTSVDWTKVKGCG